MVETCQGHARFRAGSVAAAVAPVNPLVRVQEEHHEGQIEVEFEQVQIRAVHARQANPYELVGEVFDAIETNNLLVEIPAVASGDAAEHQHDRFAGLAREPLALFVTGQPTLLGQLERR
jgi:hypothetical protein